MHGKQESIGSSVWECLVIKFSCEVSLHKMWSEISKEIFYIHKVPFIWSVIFNKSQVIKLLLILN